MATVTNKDFKIKSGLIVEGQTGTINGHAILTKSSADQTYIIGLIGGAATSENTPDTVVLRDEFGNFAAGEITASLQGNVTGDVTGTVSDISNHNTDGLSEGQNNLYFETYRATSAVAAELGTGIVYGSQGAGNVFHVDEMLIATRDYADDAAGTAQENAESYADTVSGNALTSANAYADTQAQNAQEAAEDYADGLAPNYDAAGTGASQAAIVQGNLDTHTESTSAHGVTEVVGTTESQTLSNKTLGSDLAAGGYKVSGLAEPSANQDAATKSYVDTAVADLVGAAPELLDTLNELAEAIGDDEDFIGTVNAAIGEKVAKAGDSMSGNLDFGGTNKVTSLGAPTSNGDATNKLYVDTEISDLDASLKTYADQSETDAKAYTDTREIAITSAYESYADTAEADAKTYADGLDDATNTRIDNLSTTNVAEGTNLYFTNQRAIDAVGGTIGDAIDLLDTDDIEEGTTNLYFTDSRAKDSVAQLLTGATLTNITIDGTGAGLTITAENGVADSDTDDLDEGSTNLYFTDERAQDALNGTTPNFEAVELGEISKNVAATTVVPVAGIATAYSWLKENYRSAEFLVKVANGDHTEVSKVLITLHANDNISMTEYGIVGTNGSLGSVTAAISGNDVQLQVTTANNTSTVTVVGTLLV
jgi:hypothetical protein